MTALRPELLEQWNKGIIPLDSDLLEIRDFFMGLWSALGSLGPEWWLAANAARGQFDVADNYLRARRTAADNYLHARRIAAE